MGFKVMFLGLVNYILRPDRQLLSRTEVKVASCSMARGEAGASPNPFSPWCLEKKRSFKKKFFFKLQLLLFLLHSKTNLSDSSHPFTTLMLLQPWLLEDV